MSKKAMEKKSETPTLSPYCKKCPTSEHKDSDSGLLNGNAFCLTWNNIYNDLEAFCKYGHHLGTIDPNTKELCQPATEYIMNIDNINTLVAERKFNIWCCQNLGDALEDKTIPIQYNDRIRQYSFSLYYFNHIVEINCCPWCGKNFQPSLLSEYIAILKYYYHIDDIDISALQAPERLPSELQSSAWWTKRKL